jgi:hypothetical protein
MNALKSFAIAASLGLAFSMSAAAQTSGAGGDPATSRESQSSGTHSSAGQTPPAQNAAGGQTSSIDRAPERADRTGWGWLGLLGLLGLGGFIRRRDEHRYDTTSASRKPAL